MTSESQEPLSYQWMLRAIGATLDEQRLARFTIIEIPDGFTVVWERRDAVPVLGEAHFSHATLIERAEQLRRGRRSNRRKQTTLAGTPGRRHENALRALGFEFDDCLAHGILVTEVDGDLLVTYSYVDSSQGYAWRKHMVRLSLTDIEQMVDGARDRRHRRRLLGFIR